jgi:hypothetical protein
MKSHPRSLPSIGIFSALALAAVVLAPCNVRAQPRPRRQFTAGTDCLRWLLKNAGLTATDDVSKIVQDPAHSILIVLGDVGDHGWIESNIPQGVVSYVERGGALLVASDRASGRSVSDLAGVRIAGTHLEAIERDRRHCHYNQLDRPFVIPRPISAEKFDNPFDGLRIATNIPSFLTTGDDQLGVYCLAQFLPKVHLSQDATGVFSRPREGAPFAVGGVRGEGRFLVLADHSVFINEMMLPDNCGNFAFSVRCLDWLNPPPGERSQAMLVEDGSAYPNFDVALRRLPTAPPLQLLGAMFSRRDEILDEAQQHVAQWDEREFLEGRVVRRMFGRGGSVAIRRNTLWVIGGCVLVFFFYRLSSGSRHLADRRVPLLMSAVARQRPTRALTEQRQYEQLDAGNLWESARVLARQRLSAIADAAEAPQPARVAGGSWWRRRSARRRLERLQAIAYGDAPVRIGPERWEDFLAELDAFDQDVADGTVKLPAV